MKETLTDSDAAEIYYALDSKARRIRNGDYGAADPDLDPESWAQQLEELIERIGPDGRHLIGLEFRTGTENEQEPTDQAMIDTAREIYQRDGEIEIDEAAIVSRGADDGAYVQAWVWVYFSDVTVAEGEDDETPERS